MNLPFRLSEDVELSIFSEVFNNVDIEGLTGEERIDKLDEISNKRTNALLEAMVTELSAIPNCVGLCFIETGAHGYDFQNLAIQHRDTTFTVQRWSDLSKTTEIAHCELDLDLIAELRHLRLENHIFKKDGANQNVDRKSGMQGRYAIICIVIETDAEWLSYPYLLRGGEYENNAANRILCAIWGMEKDVALT